MKATAHFSRLRSLWFGATLPLRAAAAIARNPTLAFWSILPVAVTIALYTWLLGWLRARTDGLLLDYFHLWGWDPRGWGVWAITVLSRLVLLLAGALTFSFAAAIVASPFNDILAERAEPLARPPLPRPPRRGWRGRLGLIGIDLLKSLAAAAGTLAALVLSWIPALNVAAFLLTFLLVAFQYLSYPQTRRGIGLREGWRFVLRHPLACLGFGASVSFLFAVPLVSTLAMPLAVVGGTFLFARASGDAPGFPLR